MEEGEEEGGGEEGGAVKKRACDVKVRVRSLPYSSPSTIENALRDYCNNRSVVWNVLIVNWKGGQGKSSDAKKGGETIEKRKRDGNRFRMENYSQNCHHFERKQIQK